MATIQEARQPWRGPEEDSKPKVMCRRPTKRRFVHEVLVPDLHRPAARIMCAETSRTGPRWGPVSHLEVRIGIKNLYGDGNFKSRHPVVTDISEGKKKGFPLADLND